MSTLTLSDTQWSKIVSFLQTCPDIYTGQETHLKRFIQAVGWITRSGSLGIWGFLVSLLPLSGYDEMSTEPRKEVLFIKSS